MPPPRSFYFLRHGETDWNRERRLQGWTDTPLNDTGRAQAEAAIEKLRALDIHRIVASPLARAHDTALIVNAVLQKPLAVDACLKERGYGVFEGKSVTDFALEREKAAKSLGALLEETGYPLPEGAEPYPAFRARIMESITQHLVEKTGNVLFVAHGGIYRALLRVLGKEVTESRNVQPFHFRKDGNAWMVEEA